MVDVEEQHRIRGEREERIAGGEDIRRTPPDVAQQEPRAVPAEPGVPECQPQRFSAGGQGCGEEEQAEEETGEWGGARRGEPPWRNRAGQLSWGERGGALSS
ncbi:hypothetical protein MASR1M49_14280 [Pararhodobacter aggregans]